MICAGFTAEHPTSKHRVKINGQMRGPHRGARSRPLRNIAPCAMTRPYDWRNDAGFAPDLMNRSRGAFVPPPARDQADLGTLLRAWRERALLTQEQLAARAGLNPRTVRRLETGELRRPRTSSVRALADALGLDPDERARLTRAAGPADD